MPRSRAINIASLVSRGRHLPGRVVTPITINLSAERTQNKVREVPSQLQFIQLSDDINYFSVKDIDASFPPRGRWAGAREGGREGKKDLGSRQNARLIKRVRYSRKAIYRNAKAPGSAFLSAQNVIIITGIAYIVSN